MSSPVSAPGGQPTGSAGERASPGDLTPELVAADLWTDEMVQAAGLPVIDVPFTTVGGGMGSFVLVDVLRIAGVPVGQIRVLTGSDYPWQQYEYLTRCSQVPPNERIRSDSSAIPDNIWGFPGLALREAWQDRALRPLWHVLTQSVLSDPWAPRLESIFEGTSREATRIGWSSMVAKGQVRMVRRRAEGGYFVVLTASSGIGPARRIAVRSRFVHVAVGSPGVTFLDDLRDYRATYQDTFRVVNAYEPHEHVYRELLARPGTVVVRGGGIVSSRVLQRLIDDRDRGGAGTTILHVVATGVEALHRQPRLGGTVTPRRKLWLAQLARGRREGWYRQSVGRIEKVEPGQDGTVISQLVEARTGAVHRLRASFVIDCTGLEADLREHRVLADLLDHGGAGRNAIGRLDVDRSFAVRGTESAPGRLYASGSMTLGGPGGVADSFLGLQLAAIEIADDLARQGFGQPLGVSRSVSQWWRRMRWQEP